MDPAILSANACVQFVCSSVRRHQLHEPCVLQLLMVPKTANMLTSDGQQRSWLHLLLVQAGEYKTLCSC